MTKENKTLKLEGVTFEVLTGKKAQLLVEDFNYAKLRHNTHLRDVYGSYSYAKERAFEDCDEIRQNFNATPMYICSYCIMFFTLVYGFEYYGKEYIVKETPTHRYICEIPYGTL